MRWLRVAGWLAFAAGVNPVAFFVLVNASFGLTSLSGFLGVVHNPYGDELLLEKWSYRVVEPRRGDLVIVSDPESHDAIPGRVVALPGDVVSVRSGVVAVNGVDQKLPAHTLPDNEDAAAAQVPEGSVWLLGADLPPRAYSPRLYSRMVPRSAIRGQVVGSLFPGDIGAWAVVGATLLVGLALTLACFLLMWRVVGQRRIAASWAALAVPFWGVAVAALVRPLSSPGADDEHRTSEHL